jgi:hypothetical protein
MFALVHRDFTPYYMAVAAIYGTVAYLADSAAIVLAYRRLAAVSGFSRDQGECRLKADTT